MEEVISSDKMGMDYFNEYNFIRLIETKQNPSLLEQAIINLVLSMTDEDPEKRCNVQDAIEYCEKIQKSMSELTSELLKEIDDQTLHHKKVTLNDALYRRFK